MKLPHRTTKTSLAVTALPSTCGGLYQTGVTSIKRPRIFSGFLFQGKTARARGLLLASTAVVNKRDGTPDIPGHFYPNLGITLHDIMLYQLITKFPTLCIFSVTTLHMQNSTPTVKAETCRSIHQQTKVLCKKLVFSFI